MAVHPLASAFTDAGDGLVLATVYSSLTGSGGHRLVLLPFRVATGAFDTPIELGPSVDGDVACGVQGCLVVTSGPEMAARWMKVQDDAWQTEVEQTFPEFIYGAKPYAHVAREAGTDCVTGIVAYDAGNSVHVSSLQGQEFSVPTDLGVTHDRSDPLVSSDGCHAAFIVRSMDSNGQIRVVDWRAPGDVDLMNVAPSSNGAFHRDLEHDDAGLWVVWQAAGIAYTRFVPHSGTAPTAEALPGPADTRSEVRLGRLDDGTLGVAWTTRTGISFATRGASTWSTPVTLTAHDSGHDAAGLWLAASSARFLVGWVDRTGPVDDPTDSLVSRVQAPNGTWGDPTSHADAGDPLNDVDFQARDFSFAVSYARGIQVLRSTWTPANGWTSVDALNDAGRVATTASFASAADRFVSVWAEEGGVALRSGATSAFTRPVSTAPVVTWDVADDGNGDGLAAWMQETGQHVGVFARRVSQGQWGDVERVADLPFPIGASSSRTPHLQVSGAEGVFDVAWSDPITGQAFVRRSPSPGLWTLTLDAGTPGGSLPDGGFALSTGPNGSGSLLSIDGVLAEGFDAPWGGGTWSPDPPGGHAARVVGTRVAADASVGFVLDEETPGHLRMNAYRRWTSASWTALGPAVLGFVPSLTLVEDDFALGWHDGDDVGYVAVGFDGALPTVRHTGTIRGYVGAPRVAIGADGAVAAMIGADQTLMRVQVVRDGAPVVESLTAATDFDLERNRVGDVALAWYDGSAVRVRTGDDELVLDVADVLRVPSLTGTETGFAVTIWTGAVDAAVPQVGQFGGGRDLDFSPIGPAVDLGTLAFETDGGPERTLVSDALTTIWAAQTDQGAGLWSVARH